MSLNPFSLLSIITFICCFCLTNGFSGAEHWWLVTQAFEEISKKFPNLFQTTTITKKSDVKKKNFDVNNFVIREDDNLKFSVGNFSHFFGDFVGPKNFPSLCDRPIEQVQRYFETVIVNANKEIVEKINLVRNFEWENLCLLRKNKTNDFVHPFLGESTLGKNIEQDYARASRNQQPYLSAPRPISSWDDDVLLHPSPYIELSKINYDHFQANGCAQRTYTHFHYLAWLYIYQYKKLAYGIAAEAAALHFLTDVFASGNIRTQRALIQRQCVGTDEGTGLSTCQHDEDDAMGLSVENIEGETWTAYGDHFLFTNNNKRNLELVLEASKKSIEEIFQTRVSNAALLLIPSVIHDTNFAPMFSPRVSSVYIRTPFGPGIKKPRKDVKYDEKLSIENCAVLLSRCNVRGKYEDEIKSLETNYNHFLFTFLIAFISFSFVFYGLRLFRAAIFFVGFLLCFAMSIVVFQAVYGQQDYVSILGSIGFGIFGGFVMLGVERAGFCLLGLWMGLLLASLFDTGFLHNVLDPRVATLVSFSVFGFVGCLMANFVEDLVLVVATSVVGSYCFVRTLSAYVGHWPVIEWWIEGHSSGFVPWQWYLWDFIIFVMAAWGIAVQLRVNAKTDADSPRNQRVFAG